jgi:hypothetical protein
MPQDTFLYRCKFVGDANVYYIDERDRIIWFNAYGKAIEMGRKIPDEKGKFLWFYTYNEQKFGVDNYGVIWSQTDYGAQFKVGTVEEIIYK